MDPGIVFINAKQKYSHLEIFDFFIFFRILETFKNDEYFEYYKGFYKGFVRDFGNFWDFERNKEFFENRVFVLKKMRKSKISR